MRAVAPSLALIVVGCVTVACGKSSSPPAAEQVPGQPAPRRVGIPADDWTCDVLTTPAVISETLGAPAREVSGGMTMPRGVPRACAYMVELVPGQQEAWSYDLDCRDGALATAEILFKQYQRGNAELIAAYGDASGGKPITNDAGGTLAAPGASFEVAVGQRGLDHHGQAILFVDDDAPCYGRVSGRDPVRRLALAKLVASKLKPATAPMRPRLVE